MIEDDEGIAVARRFERVDERIAFFDEEPVVPRVDDVRDVAFVDDPPSSSVSWPVTSTVIRRSCARVAVSTSLVMEDSVARADPNRVACSNLSVRWPVSARSTIVESSLDML